MSGELKNGHLYLIQIFFIKFRIKRLHPYLNNKYYGQSDWQLWQRQQHHHSLPFNRFEADFASDFENEFETQIRNEIREEVADQHRRDMRVANDELEQVKLKLSATRRQILRVHIRIRALPPPLNTVDYTTPSVNPIPYSTTIEILRSNYEHHRQYLQDRVETDDCPEAIVIEYHKFIDATTNLPPDIRDYLPIERIEESYSCE